MLAGIVTALLVGVLLFNGAILTPGALSHAALSIGPGAVLFVVAQVMEVGREIEQDRDGFV